MCSHHRLWSQDLVRKANIDQPGPHHMHGNPDPRTCNTSNLGCGWEVMPSNVKYTADHLRLTSDEFDYRQPSPQATAWKKWAKAHLVKRHPVRFLRALRSCPIVRGLARTSRARGRAGVG